MLVYDLSKAKSFNNVQKWLRNIDEHCDTGSRESLVRALLGNKQDLAGEGLRAVDEQDARQLADKFGLDLFMETSSKTGFNVDHAFTEIALNVLEKVRQD